MKRNLLVISLFFTISAIAQITVNRNHLIVSGQKVVQASDTGKHAFAAKGSNMSWDFSDLNTHILDTLRFGMPFWYPGYANFPSANLAYTGTENTNSYTFMKADNSSLAVVGLFTDTDTLDVSIPIVSKLLNFPSTFNSSFNESNSFIAAAFPLGIDPDSTGPIPFIDSVRVKITIQNISVIDGWGNMKTPIGTFATIMQSNLQIRKQSFDMKTSGFWLNIPSNMIAQLGYPAAKPDSTFSVNFWTDDATVGFPVVSYDFKPGNTQAAKSTWLQTKPSASELQTIKNSAIVIYPNPVKHTLIVSHTGQLVKVEISNSQGLLVRSEYFSDENSIDVSALTNGFYVIRISDSNTGEILYSAKIVKE